MAGEVRIWGIVKAQKAPAYNNQVRVQGIDPALGDSLTVPQWDLGEDPATDPPSHYWNCWRTSRRDDLVGLLESLGPANDPGPQNQTSYYQSDEPQTGASRTMAPLGGWTNKLVLADLLRKPSARQVDTARREA